MNVIPEPPKQSVNVTRMIIYSFIPILSIYAGWRIQKFWLLVVINFAIGLGVRIPIEMISPDPYGIIISLAIQIALSVFVVKYFAEKYNEKIESISKMPKSEDESLTILKERYAKGEITKDEFDKMKEDLS